MRNLIAILGLAGPMLIAAGCSDMSCKAFEKDREAIKNAISAIDSAKDKAEAEKQVEIALKICQKWSNTESMKCKFEGDEEAIEYPNEVYKKCDAYKQLADELIKTKFR